MHDSPATAREILIMSVWTSFPGTVIETGISRDVVGRVVTKVGLTEACLQMTSFAGVPGSRTWFPEQFVQFLQEPLG